MKSIKVVFCCIGFLCLSSCWWRVEPLGDIHVSGKIINFVSIEEAKRNIFAVAIDKNEILVLKEPESGRPFFEIVAYTIDGKIKSIKFEHILSEKSENGGCYFVEGENNTRYFLLRKDGYGYVFPIKEGNGNCSPIWKDRIGTVWAMYSIKNSSDLIIINDKKIQWLREGKIFKEIEETDIPRMEFTDGRKKVFWGGLVSVKEINIENDQRKYLKIFLDAFGFFPGHLIGYSVRENKFSQLDLENGSVRKMSSPVRGLTSFQFPNSVLFFRSDKPLFLLFNRNGVFKLTFSHNIHPEHFLVGRDKNEIVFLDKNGLWFVEFDHPQIEF